MSDDNKDEGWSHSYGESHGRTVSRSKSQDEHANHAHGECISGRAVTTGQSWTEILPDGTTVTHNESVTHSESTGESTKNE
jgi:hypothetical protein